MLNLKDIPKNIYNALVAHIYITVAMSILGFVGYLFRTKIILFLTTLYLRTIETNLLHLPLFLVITFILGFLSTKFSFKRVSLYKALDVAWVVTQHINKKFTVAKIPVCIEHAPVDLVEYTYNEIIGGIKKDYVVFTCPICKKRIDITEESRNACMKEAIIMIKHRRATEKS